MMVKLCDKLQTLKNFILFFYRLVYRSITDLLFGFLHSLVLLVHLLHGRTGHKDNQGQLYCRIRNCSTLWMETIFTAGSGYNPEEKANKTSFWKRSKCRNTDSEMLNYCISLKSVNKSLATEFVHNHYKTTWRPLTKHLCSSSLTKICGIAVTR